MQGPHVALLTQCPICYILFSTIFLKVLGCIRCPTYTLPNGLGFPAFLRNEFIGNARNQLTMGLEKVGLFTREEIDKALKISEKVNSVVTVKNSIYQENMDSAISE